MSLVYLVLFLMVSFLGVPTIQAAQNEDQEQMVVRLATESKLQPLYLAKFNVLNPKFDREYVERLEQVLSFDLSHNGMTYLVERKPEKELLANARAFEEFGSQANWQASHVFYVVKGQLKENALSLKVYSVHTNTIKSIDNIVLTGDLSQDRTQIHLLADLIHKELFGTNGIASTHILYSVKTKDLSSKENKWLSDIWEADYDGFNARQVTSNCGFCISPVYLPPKPGFLRNAFFFVSYKIGQPKIYIGSLKGGEPQRFISLKGNQLTPSVSLQRDKMAFVCDYTNNPDLFLQAFDVESGPKDKPQQIFAVPHGTQGSPALSPDGKRVAFVSNKDGSPRIYVMDIPAPGAKLKDIKPILISKYNRESSAPSWSPDGSKIVYCASTDGVRQIWMYDFKKNEEKQLTKGKGNKENPAWGPNSLHIVYNSTGSEGSELYLMNLNQTEATRISQGKGEKHFPNWEIPSR